MDVGGEDRAATVFSAGATSGRTGAVARPGRHLAVYGAGGRVARVIFDQRRAVRELL